MFRHCIDKSFHTVLQYTTTLLNHINLLLVQIIPLLFSVSRGQQVSIGYDPINRPATDSAEFWTFVDNRPVSKDGTVLHVEIYAKQSNRQIKFGVFRPTGSPEHYVLLQQHSVGSFPVGYNKVMQQMCRILSCWL